ncbi:uncharacterized protein LOC144106237 [Amblyomma americanum]
MSEETSKDFQPQEADIEQFFNQGFNAIKEFNPDADPSYRGGVMLEYTKKLSLEEARILPCMLSTKSSVKKLSIWDISLDALRVAFDKLQEWGSLEELQILHIDCDDEEFDIDLSGAFKKLRILDLRCEKISGIFALNIANYLRDNKSLQELSLWESCGGDEGASAIADALTANDTLKKLTLSPGIQVLTEKTLAAFAKTLTTNSTLELVDLFDSCSMEKEQVSSLFEQDIYADVFKRIRILWKQEFLPELIKHLREDRHCSELSVDVTASADKDLLQEFFDAVASNTTLRMLHFYPSDKCFDELADGIASVVKKTTTLKEVQNLMHVKKGAEEQLVRVLDALKENNSVTNFTMYVESLTPEIAESLSELLATNSALRDVAICEYYGITDEIVETILGGLRKNHTLTGIMVSWDPDDDVEGIAEMEQLLKRNTRLLDQAVKFVRGECKDKEAADAAKKLRSTPSLLHRLKELTGKTTEAVLSDIESALG